MAELDPTSPEYVNNPWVVEARQARAYQTGSAEFGGGGRYELSEHELEAMIKRLELLSYKISTARRTAEPMREVKPPGDDPCSKQVTEVMNASGETYLNSLQSQFESVKGLLAQMEKALRDYRGVEQGNADAVQQVHQDLDNREL